ncbi:metallophosphoesterase [Paenibacillus nasutitermitis]|uniref:Metallophosphoesterase n=1 Tax=Paenibacillus nasutitermitis TaxID=1652958 RepID=A0A916Z3X9_9BACL|nr:metallophosphoesterase [Paenibacillus nasutitermitis]GGD73411.1 metallophosphoesterase [Paenibacillus nasutitermitis]
MKTERYVSRRTFLKKSSWLLGAMLAVPSGFAYSRYLEPRMIRIVSKKLGYSNLPASYEGLRIVHFSDIHLDFHYGLERMEELVARLQELQPDLLCFTGDLYDTSIGSSAEECSRLLGLLKVPLGKWAVLGNHDYTTGAEKVASILDKGGFRVLDNAWELIEHGGQLMRIAGIDDVLRGSHDLDGALLPDGGESFTILLAHEPDIADEVLRYNVDLQLSGHSHGGQVRLPYYGALFTPELARKYPDGLYELRSGQKKLMLYTNRGIGVSTYPVRFWCRPEITVLTLTGDLPAEH